MTNSSMAAEHQNATLTAASASGGVSSSGNATLGALSLASATTAATAAIATGSASAVSFENGQYHPAGAATAASATGTTAFGASPSVSGLQAGLQTASASSTTASSDGRMSIQTQNAGNNPTQPADYAQATQPAQTMNQASSPTSAPASDATTGHQTDHAAESTLSHSGNPGSMTMPGGQGGVATGPATGAAQSAQAAPSRPAQPLSQQGQQQPGTSAQQGDARPTNGWSTGPSPSPAWQQPQVGTPTWSQDGLQAQDGKPSWQQPQKGSPTWSQNGYGSGAQQDQPGLRPAPLPVGVGPVEHGEASNPANPAEHGDSGAWLPSNGAWNADSSQGEPAGLHPFANSTAYQAQKPAPFQNLTGNGTWFESSESLSRAHPPPVVRLAKAQDPNRSTLRTVWVRYGQQRLCRRALKPDGQCPREQIRDSGAGLTRLARRSGPPRTTRRLRTVHRSFAVPKFSSRTPRMASASRRGSPSTAVVARESELAVSCSGLRSLESDDGPRSRRNALDLSKAVFEALTETSGGLDRGVVPILWGFTGNVSTVEPRRNGSSKADSDDKSRSKDSPAASSSGDSWFTGWFDDDN